MNSCAYQEKFLSNIFQKDLLRSESFLFFFPQREKESKWLLLIYSGTVLCLWLITLKVLCLSECPVSPSWCVTCFSAGRDEGKTGRVGEESERAGAGEAPAASRAGEAASAGQGEAAAGKGRRVPCGTPCVLWAELSLAFHLSPLAWVVHSPEVRLWLLSILPKAAELPHHRTVCRERVISI